MKSFPKLLSAALIAAAFVQSAQAENMVQINGAHASFFYDADFWGLGTASVVGDTISFTTPAYFNQRADGYGTNGEDTDRYTSRSAAAVVVVANTGYELSGGVTYDLTTTYTQLLAGAFATQVNVSNISSGSWNGTSFLSSTQLDQIALSLSRSSTNDGVGTSTDHNTGTLYGAGSYSTLGLDSYLFLSTTQKGSGFSEAGLSAASYQFQITAVPEPGTYGMLIAGLLVLGAVARRRRNVLGGVLLAAGGLASTAQAANYVEVVGTHVSFFYDADYWGLGAATVDGDKITLSTPAYVDRTAIAYTPSDKSERVFTDTDAAAIVAVANNGYALTGVVGYKPTVTYTLSAAGGTVQLAGSDALYYGAFDGTSFTSNGAVGGKSYDTIVSSNGTAGNGVTNDATSNGYMYGSPSVFGALAIDSSLYLSATQEAVGTTKASVSYSYDFSSITVVPEPSTYGMLLAGLGAMALVARRRQRKDCA